MICQIACTSISTSLQSAYFEVMIVFLLSFSIHSWSRLDRHLQAKAASYTDSTDSIASDDEMQEKQQQQQQLDSA